MQSTSEPRFSNWNNTLKNHDPFTFYKLTISQDYFND